MMGKRWEPQFFQVCPEAKRKIREYCKQNLAILTLAKIQEYVSSSLLDEIVVDDGNRNFIQQYRQKPPSLSTLWNWLGFNFCPRRKSFYIDGHELPAQRFDRKEFVT
jgi:hypothetical protein